MKFQIGDRVHVDITGHSQENGHDLGTITLVEQGRTKWGIRKYTVQMDHSCTPCPGLDIHFAYEDQLELA